MANAITISRAARRASVREASVSFECREACVGFNPTPTNVDWLKEAVAGAGYSIAERAR